VRLDELDYVLPPELIAQEPAPERTAARLLMVGRQPEALALYTRAGFAPIDAYGEYVGSPLSVCMAKPLHAGVAE